MDATTEQRQQLARILTAFLLTVKETGDQGAPSGPMYLAAMSAGMSLDHYLDCMGWLVDKGMIRKSGDVYFYIG